MAMLLIDSRSAPEDAARFAKIAKEHRDLELVDTADWDDERRRAMYFHQLMPMSVLNQKRLRGVLRTHKAGNIFFGRGVLIDHATFYVGDEIREALKAE